MQRAITFFFLFSPGNLIITLYQLSKIVFEYDQEIPQSQTADNPWHREEEPLNPHETPGRQIKQPAASSPSR